MALTKRVEVLFDPQKYSYLEHIAREEKITVGELIREAVDKMYLEADVEKRREAAAWLVGQRLDFGGDWDHIKKAIARQRYKDIMKSVEGLDQHEAD